MQRPLNDSIPLECQKEPLMYMRKAQVENFFFLIQRIMISLRNISSFKNKKRTLNKAKMLLLSTKLFLLKRHLTVIFEKSGQAA